MNLFFTLGSTDHGPFWPKWPNMAGLSTFQSGQKGSKRSKMVYLIFFTIWDPFGQHGPFWTISNKNWFFAPKHLWQTLLVLLGQKNHFCLEWSKRVQMGPKWPTRVKNSYVDYFGPFWTLLDYLGMLTSLQWLAIFGPKWTIFGLSWAVDPNIKKAHHQVSFVWPACKTLKLPLSYHEWQAMGPKEVFYSYLVPEMIW